jgi:hypothetical protein
MLGNIIPFVFQGERFFREAWPQIRSRWNPERMRRAMCSGSPPPFSLDAHRLVVVARK